MILKCRESFVTGKFARKAAWDGPGLWSREDDRPVFPLPILRRQVLQFLHGRPLARSQKFLGTVLDFDPPLDEVSNECAPLTILVRISRGAWRWESSEKQIGEAPGMTRGNELLVQHEPRRRSQRQ